MAPGIFVPVPNCMQLVVEWGNSSIQWTNGFWFRKEGFVTADLQDAAEALNAVLVTDYLSAMMSAWYLRKVTAIDMTEQGAPSYIHTNGVNAGGTGGDVAPITNCLVVTLRTAKRGRAYRGRLYLAGFEQDDLNAQQLNDAGVIGDVELAMQAVLADMATAGFTWVVAHRYTGSTPLETGTSEAVTSTEVRNNYLGSQRRRTRRP